MQQMYSCPKCGAQVVFGTPACPNCRTPLNWPSQPQAQPPPGYQQQMYSCPNCGAQMVFGTPSCPNCRTPLNWPSQQDYQPQEPKRPQKSRMSNATKGALGLSIAFVAVIGSCVLCLSGDSEAPTYTSPTITSDEQAYAHTVGNQCMALSQACIECGELLENPLMGDTEWTIDMATQLTIIQQLYSEAMELEPPNSMLTIHYKYVQSMSHFNKATSLLATGIDTLDPTLMEQAITELELGNQFMIEAGQLVNDFVASRT